MRDIWDRDEAHIAVKWDEIYQKKYMGHIASNGMGHESQLKGVCLAYEHACLEVMKLYNISINKLDKIISRHSGILNKKKPKTKKDK